MKSLLRSSSFSGPALKALTAALAAYGASPEETFVADDDAVLLAAEVAHEHVEVAQELLEE